MMNYLYEKIVMVGSECRDEGLAEFAFVFMPFQLSTLTSQHVFISFPSEIIKLKKLF